MTRTTVCLTGPSSTNFGRRSLKDDLSIHFFQFPHFGIFNLILHTIHNSCNYFSFLYFSSTFLSVFGCKKLFLISRNKTNFDDLSSLSVIFCQLFSHSVEMVIVLNIFAILQTLHNFVNWFSFSQYSIHPFFCVALKILLLSENYFVVTTEFWSYRKSSVAATDQFRSHQLPFLN